MGAICHPRRTASLQKLAQGISEFLMSDLEQSREKMKQDLKERSLSACVCVLACSLFCHKLCSHSHMLKLQVIQRVNKVKKQDG